MNMRCPLLKIVPLDAVLAKLGIAKPQLINAKPLIYININIMVK